MLYFYDFDDKIIVTANNYKLIGNIIISCVENLIYSK